MNLQGSITELQDSIVQLYLELQKRFSENQLIRDLWSSMAQDILLQKRSMVVLPNAFWNQLKGEQDKFLKEIAAARHQTIEKKEDISLIHCFERAFLYEEPATLKVYVPIIRKLRQNWTDQALDFYIMVKAHLARITRATQSFAGDPQLLQRSNLLLQQFEKAVQEPQIQPAPKRIQAHAAAPVPQAKQKPAAKPQKKAAPKKKPALAKHAAARHSRSKPLVEKIQLPRRRAQR